MGTFTWEVKEPVTNWSGGKVIGFNYTATKTEGGKTATTGGCEAFGPADIKEASYWTQEKIDEHAEAWRIGAKLDDDLDTQLAAM